MNTPRQNIRSGFSLIELLIVIGIIAFLAAALAFTIPNILTSAKVASTRATITKVSGLLEKRMHAISRELEDQDKMAIGGVPAYALDIPDPGNAELRKVLGRKAFLKRYLPMTFLEADDDNEPAVTATHNPDTENAELLYFILTQGAQLDAAPVETDAFNSSELADSDGDGAFEIVDAWGKPLRFYRWPTRLIRPAAAGNEGNHQDVEDADTINPPDPDAYVIKINPGFTGTGISARVLISSIGIPTVAPITWADELDNQPLARDPDDPLGLTHLETSDVGTFEDQYHTPDTWHAPLVVSAGRDGILGLYEPYDTANHGHLAQPDLNESPPASGLFPGLEGLLDNLTNMQE